MNTQELIKDITDKIQTNANVKVVFGDPIKEEGITIIPVAKIRVRGGGGGGRGKNREVPYVEGENPDINSGMGVGIAIDSTPLGYIRVSNGQAEFIEIVDKTRLVLGGMLTAVVSFLLISRAVRR